MARTNEERAVEVARDMADAQTEAERIQPDETIEGGVYEVDGQLVNANDEPVSRADAKRAAMPADERKD